MTLFVSRVVMRRPELIHAGLRDASVFHVFIMSLFPPAGPQPRRDQGILWVQEGGAGSQTLTFMVQSTVPPRVEHIRNRKVRESTAVNTKQVDELYRRIISAETFSYRILVNPIVRVGNKVHGQTTPHQVGLWWQNQRFAHPRDADEFQVQIEEPTYLRRGGVRLPLAAATVAGRTRTVDSDNTLLTIRNGIGRSKSFGFGMMLIGS